VQPGPTGHRDRVRRPGSAAGTPPKQGPPGGAPGPRPPPRGTPHAPPRPAVLGSVRGRSRHRRAGLLRVSAQAGLTGSRAAAPASAAQPAPAGRSLGLARAERGHALTTKRRPLGLGTARERDTGPLRHWAWGRRAPKPRPPRGARRAPWDVNLAGPAQGATEASLLPPAQLGQRTAPPQAIARPHGRPRPGGGRCQRTSIRVSQSQEMVALTMALVATFWVTGNQDELLSLRT